MASIAVTTAGGEVAAHGTLVANTVDTVTFDRDIDTVAVINVDGAAAIFVTVDGSAPDTSGSHSSSYRLPAAVGSMPIDVPTGGGTVVKLKSTGTPKYSVQVSSMQPVRA